MDANAEEGESIKRYKIYHSRSKHGSLIYCWSVVKARSWAEATEKLTYAYRGDTRFRFMLPPKNNARKVRKYKPYVRKGNKSRSPHKLIVCFIVLLLIGISVYYIKYPDNSKQSELINSIYDSVSNYKTTTNPDTSSASGTEKRTTASGAEQKTAASSQDKKDVNATAPTSKNATINEIPLYTEPLEAKIWYDTSGADRYECLAVYRGTPLEKYINKSAGKFDELSELHTSSVTGDLSYDNNGVPQLTYTATLSDGWHWDDGSTVTTETWKFFVYNGTNIENEDIGEYTGKQLYNTDKRYRQIIDIAMKLCEEIEYNWSDFSGYDGAVPQLDATKRHEVCDGYSKIAKSEFINLECVDKVLICSGENHAWNMLVLDDGRKLYLDLTWFDNETIDSATGRIKQLDDYDWANITFDEETFKYSGIGYGSGVFTHSLPYTTK